MFRVQAVRGRLDGGAWHLTHELEANCNTMLVFCKHLTTSTDEPRTHTVMVDLTKMYARLDADGEAEGVKGVATCTLTPLVAAYSECPETARATVRLDAVNQAKHAALWIEIDMSRRHMHPSRASKRKAEEPADESRCMTNSEWTARSMIGEFVEQYGSSYEEYCTQQQQRGLRAGPPGATPCE